MVMGKLKAIDLDAVIHMYLYEKMSLRAISRELDVCHVTLSHRLEAIGFQLKSKSQTMQLIYPKSGQRMHNGYVQIYQPDHPRCDRDGYVLEHIVVWERHHGESLPRSWHIHHLNGLKADNRPCNLVAISLAKHLSQHRISRLTVARLMQKRIRELEIEMDLLKRALQNNQLIFRMDDN